MSKIADKQSVEYGVINFDATTGKGTFEINIPEYERKLATGLYAPIQLLYNHLLCVEEVLRQALNISGQGILKSVISQANGVVTLNMQWEELEEHER